MIRFFHLSKTTVHWVLQILFCFLCTPNLYFFGCAQDSSKTHKLSQIGKLSCSEWRLRMRTHTCSRLPCYVICICLLSTNKNPNANKWMLRMRTHTCGFWEDLEILPPQGWAEKERYKHDWKKTQCFTTIESERKLKKWKWKSAQQARLKENSVFKFNYNWKWKKI